MAKDAETARPPTTWEKFVQIARKVAQTPKAEVDKRERVWRDRRRKRRDGRSSA